MLSCRAHLEVLIPHALQQEESCHCLRVLQVRQDSAEVKVSCGRRADAQVWERTGATSRPAWQGLLIASTGIVHRTCKHGSC